MDNKVPPRYFARPPQKFMGGLGLRSQHYPYLLETKPKYCSWFEVISENYMETEGRPIVILEKLRQDFPIALHGVSLSIGSPEPINLEYLIQLKKLLNRVDPFIVSDHFCWTGAHSINSHDLLPIPYTKKNLSLVIEKVNQVQDFLNRPILLENPSAYITFDYNEMVETSFISQVCQKSGCGILLDINNVYVTCNNFNLNPFDYLDQIPIEKIGQIHLAGFTDMGSFLYDTHSNPVHNNVWRLFEYLMNKKWEVPVMIEWDDDIPEFDVLENELLKAIEIQSRVFLNIQNKILTDKNLILDSSTSNSSKLLLES